MKKAKILFSAMLALAVVGGAFAFKAQKFTSDTVYTKDAFGNCNQALLTKITNVAPSVTVSASTVQGGTCTTIHVTAE
jgi:CDP-diacylglycerol pyrophosphatase